MADSSAQAEEPPKDKKKRKSNLKKPDLAQNESAATAPAAPESRQASLVPPPTVPEEREAPAAPESRKASLVPPPDVPETPSRSSSTKRGSIPQPPSTIRRASEMRGSRKAASVLEDLDEAKLLELKEAFKLFDMDQDGFISGIDLKQTFGTLGKTDVTDEEIRQMLSEASNPLDFDAFVMLLGFKTISLDPEEILLDALGKWDKNNSGFIEEERIKHDLMTWGDKFTSAEVDVALEDAPTFVNNGQHMIDYVKFCKLLCGLRKKTRDVTIEDFMT